MGSQAQRKEQTAEPLHLARTSRAPFVRFPKSLFDAILLAPMPATHLALVLVVIRLTLGHHDRTQAPIALSLFAKMTGRGERGIRRALEELVAEGVLRVTGEFGNRQARSYAVNLDPQSWGRYAPWRGSLDPLRREAEWNARPTREGVPDTTLEGVPGPSREEHLKQHSEERPPSVGPEAPGRGDGVDGRAVLPSTPQDFVAFAADYASSHGFTLTSSHKAQIGRQVKELLAAGAQPDDIAAALRHQLDENRPPAALSYLVGDQERSRHGRPPTYRRGSLHNGRSRNGEF